ncbi:MAG TPA: MBL fold metallo-hydrolase [Acidimicrobiales bacterium]|jgi:glyoxylase-like metal-dependent hydrolase (beta-lactamase superfamily II)|nr:MBL fold metallo-hydrolase [Acidimicrobiales bacterium]
MTGTTVDNDRFYFRQLLSGLDLAVDDMMAMQMANFVYLLGDRETGEAVAVDLAYDVPGALDMLEADGMRLTGVLATHYHPDHVGGSLAGYSIAGITDIVERVDVPIHVQADEEEWVLKATGIDRGALVTHDSGDIVTVGEIPITLVHTPGHTPGSQCFLVEGRLVSGDTLFLDGCGRTDLPGSDPEQMWFSLTERLAKVPDDTILFPGHLYSEKPSASMAETRSRNVVFRPSSKDQWLMMFGNA